MKKKFKGEEWLQRIVKRHRSGNLTFIWMFIGKEFSAYLWYSLNTIRSIFSVAFQSLPQWLLSKSKANPQKFLSECFHSPHNQFFFIFSFWTVKHEIFNHQCFIGTHQWARQKLNCFYLHGLMQTTDIAMCLRKKAPSKTWCFKHHDLLNQAAEKVNNWIESF